MELEFEILPSRTEWPVYDPFIMHKLYCWWPNAAERQGMSPVLDLGLLVYTKFRNKMATFLHG